ncbi:MAG: polyprenol monophosphomannose synthase, partial [Planctomycetes bacterium]|nr:polyprenol monophosphomannose synthase [Planctomycetota bacterium]
MASPRILVVIPTYNEKANISRMLDGLMALELDLGVMFVDDDSPDGTAEVVKEQAMRWPERAISVFSRINRPRGLGAAYKDGFQEAIRRGAEIVVQMDCDGQHPIDVVPKLVQALEEQNADLVLASRYVEDGGTGSWNLFRKLISVGTGFFSRFMLRLPQKDLTGGFKCWRASMLDKVGLELCESQGFVFQIEMTMRANKVKAKIIEVP